MSVKARRAAAALLGALLIDPFALEGVRKIVAPEDFPTPSGREVYATMLALDAKGMKVDFVTVASELETRGSLEHIGTAPLVELINRCPTSLHAEDYARILAEDAEAWRPKPQQSLVERLGMAG